MRTQATFEKTSFPPTGGVWLDGSLIIRIYHFSPLPSDLNHEDTFSTSFSGGMASCTFATNLARRSLNSVPEGSYLPILFDFSAPTSRNVTETLMTLAAMARFVIADITDLKSASYELMTSCA